MQSLGKNSTLFQWLIRYIILNDSLPTGTVAAVENVEAGNETVDLFPQNIGLCFASDEVQFVLFSKNRPVLSLVN